MYTLNPADDWSHESVEMDDVPLKAKAAHIRLCHSRMFLVIAYPRKTQEMVFDAHMRAFEFFAGVARTGVAVDRSHDWQRTDHLSVFSHTFFCMKSLPNDGTSRRR